MLPQRTARRLAALVTAGLLGACGVPPLPELPESSAVRTRQTLAVAQHHLVATGHPLASRAALTILKAGGAALDAAIAAQMVLALVEPQSSGIGGGALLMHWDGREVQAWDGRETAPAAVDEGLLLGADGRPLELMAAAVGGRAVGTPGAVRMLEAAHRRHGRLPWARLFEPAIEAADRGFPISPRLHSQLMQDAALRRDPLAGAHFYGGDGRPHAAGHLLRNPALAAVLRRIAAEGSVALHQGPVAQDIVRRVRGHVRNPGHLSLQDLAEYRPLLRAPICTVWRLRYRVCGFPPPSSGHIATMQTLGLLEALGPPPDAEEPADGAPSVPWIHRFTEAGRLAYADRAQYLADPGFRRATGRALGLTARPRLSAAALETDRRAQHETRATRAAAGPGILRRGPVGRFRRRHQPHQHRRSTGSGGLADDDHRGRIRRAADERRRHRPARRLPAEQPAHGLLRPGVRRAGAEGRQPRAAGQASAIQHVRRRWCSTTPAAHC